MIKRLLLAIILWSQLLLLHAGERFLIYHTKHDVRWIHEGITEKAKRGVFIQEKQQLVVAALSGVMLVRKDGCSLLIDKNGIYSFAQIQQLFRTSKQHSSTTNFLSYVFEKFTNGNENEDQQKVTAAVFRSRQIRTTPRDSSFVFTIPIALKWETVALNIPHRLKISMDSITIDTTIRGSQTYRISDSVIIKTSIKRAVLIKWTCENLYSKDGNAQVHFLMLPKQEDIPLIRQQLKIIRKTNTGNPYLIRLLERDLFERWMNVYQLN
jgi:hypothetical protein